MRIICVNGGGALANALSNREHLEVLGNSEEVSSSILNEIKSILQSPEGKIDPITLSQNLANTIEGVTPELRRDISDEIKNGRTDLLRRRLSDSLEGSSFRPSRLGLEEGKSTAYYLSILDRAIESSQKLDQLAPLYIFSKNVPDNKQFGDYLEDIGEGEFDHIKDKNSRGTHVNDILKVLPPGDQKQFKRILHKRLKGLSKDINGHKKIITEVVNTANARLTLTEVHPHLAIFRGNLGGDCATSFSCGYSNSPMERVFFISNARGEAVGYLNGTTVKLPNGENAFFINTVAGPKISGLMTESIFSAIAKAKDNLGVEDVVILGKDRVHGGNINYSVIRSAYDNAQGDPVKITFEDRDIRKIIGKHHPISNYDRAENLTNAHYLKESNANIVIQVEKQPFHGTYSSMRRKEISPIDRFRIFELSPALASRLEIAPPLVEYILKKDTFSYSHFTENIDTYFFYFRNNEKRINTVAYENKWERILNAFKIEKKEHRRVLDELGIPYYAGRLRSPDAFLKENAEESVKMLKSILKLDGIDMREQFDHLAKYKDAYKNFNPALKNSLDTPEYLVVNFLWKNAKKRIMDPDGRMLRRIGIAQIIQRSRTPLPEGELTTILRKLREDVKVEIMDRDQWTQNRVDIAEKYSTLDPEGIPTTVLRELWEDVKVEIMDTKSGLRARILLAQGSRTFAPKDDFVTLERMLQESVEAEMVDSSIDPSLRLNIFDTYEEFAPQKNIAIIRQNLQKALFSEVLDTGRNLSKRLHSLRMYGDTALNDEAKKASRTRLEMVIFREPSFLEGYINLHEEGLGVEHPARIKERLIAKGVDPSKFRGLLILDPPAQTRSEFFDSFVERLKHEGFCH